MSNRTGGGVMGLGDAEANLQDAMLITWIKLIPDDDLHQLHRAAQLQAGQAGRDRADPTGTRLVDRLWQERVRRAVDRARATDDVVPDQDRLRKCINEARSANNLSQAAGGGTFEMSYLHEAVDWICSALSEVNRR